MRLRLLVMMLLAAVLAVGACSDSDDSEEDTSSDTTEQTDSSESGDGADSNDSDRDDAVSDAVETLESQGLSPELAECTVDSLVDQGVDIPDLEALATPDEGLLDALALAGGECAEFIDGLPEGSFDLDDPAVRNGFITSFSASSGLSEEVGECVLDELIANDVDIESIINGSPGGVPDEEITTAVQDAVTTCS